MKTKLKFFFLALLGIILIPTTNAYEMSEIRNWSEDWTPPTTTRHKGMCLNYNRDLYMTFDWGTSSYSSISSDNTSCPEWVALGNFFAPRDYSYPWNQWIYNDYFSYVNSKQNGEWMDMIRTVYQNGEHKTVITTLPSRTAYKRTSNAGIDYMFTQIYFYHNQFILYDPVKEVGLSFLGKMNVVGGAVFANPWVLEDNLRFIDYVRKKAYSATITNTEAWKWLLWTDVSMSRLQSINWSKSYTMNKGGSSFLPPNFKIDKQGSEWFQYIEDIEFTAPDWNAGKPNNNWTGQNQALVEYNACFKYYNSIKKYTSYNYNCYKTLLDTAPLTWSYDSKKILKPWQEIEDWDWESDFAVSTENVVCNSFARVKRDYKQQYKEKWEDFLKVSSENFFYPHTMDIKGYCWERPKLEDNSSWWDKTKDFFLWRTGEPRMVDDNWKKYYENDFDPEWRKLRSLYARCQGLDKRWIMKSFTMKEWERLQYCSEYKTEKEKFMKKWEHATIWKFFWWSLQASILAIEWSGKGDWVWSWFFHKLKNDVSNSIIWDSFSYVGEAIFGRIKAPFYSWYNSVLWVNCANSGVPHIEIMDYIAMGFFALLAFLIFNIL